MSILTVMVIWLSIWNAMRLVEAIFFWKTLLEYGTHPLYISISGGVWLITGLFLVWGLWHGKAWGWIAAISGTAIYTSWYWVDRSILQEPHSNWPFALIINIILLFLVFFILFSRRTRRFFKER